MQLDLSARESSLIWITLQRLLLTFLPTHRHLLGCGSSRAFEFRSYSWTFLVRASSIWMINLRTKFSFAYNLPKGKQVQLGKLHHRAPSLPVSDNIHLPNPGQLWAGLLREGEEGSWVSSPLSNQESSSICPRLSFCTTSTSTSWEPLVCYLKQSISWIPIYSALILNCLGYRWIYHCLEVTEPRTSILIITLPCKCGRAKTPSTHSAKCSQSRVGGSLAKTWTEKTIGKLKS